MVTEATFPNPYLSLNQLSNYVEPVSKAKIKAKWFVIRVNPDLATGELLNIGVGIIYKKEIYTKFLPSAEPFRVLYGQNGLDNFGFLLNLVKGSINLSNLTNTISPQIKISKPQFVAGSSTDSILNRLYDEMITLDLIKESEKYTSNKNISTDTLRAKVFSQLKSNSQELAKRVWRGDENPIIIPTELGETTTLNHIQLWSPPDFTNNAARFGSLVSMDYQQLNFAELYLLQANQDIQSAATSITKAEKKAGLFIYRPDNNQSEKFDNLIDRTEWLLNKQIGRNFKMEVESNIEKLTSYAQEFAA